MTLTSPGIPDSPAVSSSFAQTRPHHGTPSSGRPVLTPCNRRFPTTSSVFPNPWPSSSSAQSTAIEAPPAVHHWSRSKLEAAIDLLPPAVSPRPGPQESIPGETSTFPAPFPLSLLAGALPHAARAPRSGSSGLGLDHPAPSIGKKYCWAGSSGLTSDHPISSDL